MAALVVGPAARRLGALALRAPVTAAIKRQGQTWSARSRPAAPTVDAQGARRRIAPGRDRPRAGQRPRGQAGGPARPPRRADPGRRRRGRHRPGHHAHPRRRPGQRQARAPTATRAPTRQTDEGRVFSKDLQIVVNGLWEAGAEAISVNGQRLTSAVGDPLRRRGDPRRLPPAGPALRHQRHRRPREPPGRVRRQRRAAPTCAPSRTTTASVFPWTRPTSSPSRPPPSLTVRDATEASRADRDRHAQHHRHSPAPPTDPDHVGELTVIPLPRPHRRRAGRAPPGARRAAVALQPYLPIAVIAALDAVFGAVRAVLDGIFNDKVFVVSFLANVVVARSSSSSATSSAWAPSCPPASSSSSACGSSPTSPRSAGTCSRHEPAPSPRARRPAPEPPGRASARGGTAAPDGAAPGDPGERLRRAAGASSWASPSPRRCSRPTRAGWSSCARTSWSASSTTSARSRTGSATTRRELRGQPRPAASAGSTTSAEALKSGPGAARHPAASSPARSRPPGPGIVHHDHRPRPQGHRRPCCSTPCRSCATPAPRRSRSATSGWSPSTWFADVRRR